MEEAMQLFCITQKSVLGLVLLFAFGSAEAQTRPAPDDQWHVQPVAVASRLPFHMAVVHSQYGSCQTEFTHTSITIDSVNKKISTQFGVTLHPDHICIQNVSPYGPSFAMPSLPAGNYQVDVTVLPACAIPATPTSPICLIQPVPTQAAEPLRVLDTTLTFGKGWYLANPSTPANSDFVLKLRNLEYPPCRFTFAHATSAMDGNQISLRFTVEENQSAICPDVITAGGPDFSIPKLPAGDYPILISIEPTCMYTTPICPVAWNPGEWVATLHVSATTSLLSPARRRPALLPHRGLLPHLLGRILAK
jgi:hypothetical protein